MSGVDIGSGPAAQNRLPLEERKGRIRSMEVARTKSRLWTRRPEAGSLRVGLEVTRSVSAADLRTLAGVRYEQPVVSVYLNAAPQGVVGRPRVHLTVFNSMRRREVAARSEMIDGLSGPHRQVLFADLDEVVAEYREMQ